jgi:PHP family Zn ribbon phosphoesterase
MSDKTEIVHYLVSVKNPETGKFRLAALCPTGFKWQTGSSIKAKVTCPDCLEMMKKP